MDSLSEDEQKEYKRMMENLRYQASVVETGRLEGIEKGCAEGDTKGYNFSTSGINNSP